MRLQDYPYCQMFTIPGNHDHFNFEIYVKYFLQRHFLGGWMLPQTRSYFALRFPHNVWFFCLDIGLENGVDAVQLAYFLRLVETLPPQGECRVILGQHEPTWLTSDYNGIQNIPL